MSLRYTTRAGRISHSFCLRTKSPAQLCITRLRPNGCLRPTLRQCRCPREGGSRSLTDANRGERHAVEIQRVEEGPLGGLHAPQAAATERVACCCMPHVAYAVRRMLHVARAVPTWLGSAVVCCMMLPHAPQAAASNSVVCGIRHLYLPHAFRPQRRRAQSACSDAGLECSKAIRRTRVPNQAGTCRIIYI